MTYQKNFVGTQDRVWISHGKRAIGPSFWGSTVIRTHQAKRCLAKYVDKKDPDQPAHLRSLIQTFAVRLHKY